MKIICKWVFRDGKDLKELTAKQKDVSDMNGEQLHDMLTSLLAQPETVRIMFERK